MVFKFKFKSVIKNTHTEFKRNLESTWLSAGWGTTSENAQEPFGLNGEMATTLQVCFAAAWRWMLALCGAVLSALPL